MAPRHSIAFWLWVVCPLTQSVQSRWIPIFGGSKSVNLRQVFFLLDPSSPSLCYNPCHRVGGISGGKESSRRPAYIKMSSP
ncbi:uncharacterized protein F4812DRAFT_441567 [Daldinia caldariorum]|uniref:uncharacterized protein n=1 Tax=Daldinia caldariorum TaxID=326644 RepID=UPI0020082655|nr:uncharacterized protein F4812DRAFT_441567 [Daldinia caldariorum]KAI1464678.1 hypothetical protein F4812DRAFT_441567 [Daldinia caldariorum]